MYIKHCELRRNNLYFGGCDYFGLARDKQIIEALIDAAQEWGISAGASRFTSGNHQIHIDLELLIAESVGSEACAILPSGYLANVAIAETLARLDKVCLMLQSAHPSIASYPGKSIVANTIEELLININDHEKNEKKYAVFIDAVDPISGAVQQTKELLKIVKTGILIIDHSHIFGLSLHKCTQPQRKNVIVTSSLSKIIGQHGGFIAATSDFIKEIARIAPVFKYATPLPPALCASAIQAIKLCQDEKRSKALQKNINLFNSRIEDYVSNIERGIPVYALAGIGRESSSNLADRLLRNGIYIPYIEKYGNTNNGVLRLSLSSQHTEVDINFLCDTLMGKAS